MRELKKIPRRSFFRIYNDKDDAIYWYQCYDPISDSIVALAFNNDGCLTSHRLPGCLKVVSV